MIDAKAPFLAADIGGTHARLGLVALRHERDQQVSVLCYRRYLCADYPNLASILRNFIHDLARETVDRGVLACAGYSIDGVVVNVNLPWTVSLPELRQSLNIKHLSFLNDFEAVAYAARFIDRADTLLLAGPENGEGPSIVVGPGTGLGSAVSIPNEPHPIVLPTEAGQIDLAPGTRREREVLERLAGERSYVSYDQILSGPGLCTLYRALSAIRGDVCRLRTPEAVTAAAQDGSDAIARETLDMFCALLGSFVGNLAMLYGARGGVYLTGGILPHIGDFLKTSSFVDRFLNKGRMRAYLERVSIRLMEHSRLGVIGAAGWYLDHVVEK
jgi:glucokinase